MLLEHLKNQHRPFVGDAADQIGDQSLDPRIEVGRIGFAHLDHSRSLSGKYQTLQCLLSKREYGIK